MKTIVIDNHAVEISEATVRQLWATKEALLTARSGDAPQIRGDAVRLSTTLVAAMTTTGCGFVWDGQNVSIGAFTIALAEQIEGYISGIVGTDLPKVSR